MADSYTDRTVFLFLNNPPCRPTSQSLKARQSNFDRLAGWSTTPTRTPPQPLGVVIQTQHNFVVSILASYNTVTVENNNLKAYDNVMSRNYDRPRRCGA